MLRHAICKQHNMKHIFIIAALLVGAFASCQNTDGDVEGGSSDEKKEKKKVSKRDYSITKANSYSTIFFDSLQLEKYVVENNIPDSISRRMRSFYNTRNYQYAWFSQDGFTEQALGFWNLYDYHLTYGQDSTLTEDKKLHNRMEALMVGNFSVSASNASYLKTELQLTERLITYSLKNFQHNKYVKRKELERFVPFKKQDAMYLADSLLNKKHKDNKYFEDINEAYGQLKKELQRYYNIAKQGGWQAIAAPKKGFKKGVTDPAIRQIKQRLSLTGDLTVRDTSQVYNDTLELAVKRFQRRFGLTEDGVVNANLVKEMNVPAVKRVQQLLLNLERMRWMPSRPDGELIMVNIPEFVLHVTENKKKVFDMAVVVGKQGNNTMMFTGDLNQVVFSPYWNVPSSIVKEEILPELQKDPMYLEKENMEQVGMEGDLPAIRQRPGAGNALGKVKFLFPNKFNIYFHDTPSKSLFKRDKRAFSHGCIRLSDPEKMANYLLRHNDEWTPSRIVEAMNAGVEKFVKLKKSVPVFITYYTAWVDDEGLLNFREDIYKHDAKVMSKMFKN